MGRSAWQIDQNECLLGFAGSLGGFGTQITQNTAQKTVEVRTHTEIDPQGSAEMLKSAQKIVIVPGYGLAVAQAAGECAVCVSHCL